MSFQLNYELKSNKNGIIKFMNVIKINVAALKHYSF